MKIKIKCTSCDYCILLEIVEMNQYITNVLEMDCVYCGDKIKYKIPSKHESFDLNKLMSMFGMKK